MKARILLGHVVKYRFMLLLMLPGFIVFAVNGYLPMFGLLIAFKDVNYMDGLLGSPWVGLRNFEFLFSTTDAWKITRNTVAYNFVFILTGLILSVAIALGLNEIKNKLLSKVYSATIILPNFLSMVIVSYVVYAFLNIEYGYLNKSVLEMFGIPEVSWYSEPEYWPYILTLTYLWKQVGIGSVIYLAAITGIDEQLYEAAIIDGASKGQQIRHITIPLITPVIIIITILSLGGIFKSDFGLFYQVTLNSGALYPVTDVIDTYVYRALISLNDIGMSSAANFYQSVVGLFLILGANWIVKRINSDHALF